MRQLPGELLFVPQQRADAVEEGVQRTAQLGEFGGRVTEPKRSWEAIALHWVACSVIERTGRRARPTASRVSAYVQASIAASRARDAKSIVSAELRYGERSSAVTTAAAPLPPGTGREHSRTSS